MKSPDSLQSPPLVSVIIVNYNGGSYLLDTVYSVMISDVSFEIFVVDNGSVDNSLSLLRDAFGQDPRVCIVENGENLGFAQANNVALARSSGDFLLLLNPDCIVERETLRRMVDSVRADPSVGMAGCLILNPDGTEQAGCRRTIPTPWTGLVRVLHLNRVFPSGKKMQEVDLLYSPLPDKPVYVEAISGAFMMVRREALEQVGLMDGSYFLHCEDLDWCKAFKEAGWNIQFQPRVDIVHHKGTCSTSRPVFVLWHKHRGMVKFYRKFLSRDYPSVLNLLVVLGVWIRFAAMVPVELSRNLRLPKALRAPTSVVPLTKPAPVEQLPLFPELQGRQVLVTGGTGFIGSRLVWELIRQGAQVRIISRSPDSGARRWQGRPVDFFHGDLEDPASLRHACDGVDTLFHLAGCAHVLDDPEGGGRVRHTQVTEQGTRALLQEAQRAGIRSLVFVSSVKAMGEEDERCLDETSDVHPESPYGVAKLHAEQAVLAAGRKTAMHASVLRLPMVYGPGNKGNLPRMIEAIRKGSFPPLPEVHNRRSMVHVDDSIQAMLLMGVRDAANGEVYIITDGHDYSTRQICDLIAVNLGKQPPRWTLPLGLIKVGARVGDQIRRLGLPAPLNSAVQRKLFGSAWYCSDKIREQLGFVPHYDLSHALPGMVAEQESEAGRTHKFPVADSPSPKTSQPGMINAAGRPKS